MTNRAVFGSGSETNDDTPLFSICIPAYNRARFLPALLNSVFAQEYDAFEVVICEDHSPERSRIAAIVREFAEAHPGKIKYIENEENLGYDGNIRELIERSSGCYCFFMGNDDVMVSGALVHTAEIVRRHPDAALVLKSYAWFDETPEAVNQEVRYFDRETVLAPGAEAISICFRRSGVISGYIIDRDLAQSLATSRFDGTLYYQLYLTAQALVDRSAVCTPKVIVLCRGNEPPDFGNSASEKGKFIPGTYTPAARLRMVAGAVSIVRDLAVSRNLDVTAAVIRDYANYFYPFIRDQLDLGLREYYALYRGYGRMGFSRHLLFHVYFVVAYVLGAKRFDNMTRVVRRLIGRSPHFGLAGRRG